MGKNTSRFKSVKEQTNKINNNKIKKMEEKGCEKGMLAVIATDCPIEWT